MGQMGGIEPAFFCVCCDGEGNLTEILTGGRTDPIWVPGPGFIKHTVAGSHVMPGSAACDKNPVVPAEPILTPSVIYTRDGSVFQHRSEE